MSYIYVIAILLILSAISGLIYFAARSKTVEPDSEPVYNDLSSRGKVLLCHRLKITGKPDMIMRKGNLIIPMEYKSTTAETPRTGHILQMAAYFALLEENYPGKKINYGILEYSGRKFEIRNTLELRRKLIEVLQEMRTVHGTPERKHHNSGKCFRCSFNDSCQQNLITARK